MTTPSTTVSQSQSPRASEALTFAVGWAGALVLGLASAYLAVKLLADRLAALFSTRASSSSVTYEGGADALHQSDNVAYLVVLATTAGVVALWAAVDQRVDDPRRRSVFRALTPLAALLCASLLGLHAVGVALVVLVGALPYASLALPAVQETPASPALGRSLTVLTYVACVTYACWVCVSPRSETSWYWAVSAVTVTLLGWRLFRRTDRGASMAAVGSPLLLLPLLGLLRAPSPVLPGLVVALVLVLEGWPTLRARLVRFDGLAVGVGAPLAVVAMLVIPLGMRELPSLNWDKHEGFHAAWINSALNGKVFMADTSLFYGPLREYALLLFLKATSVTMERLRMAHVLLNLLGAAVVLAISWPLVRKKAGLQWWLAYMFIAHSPLRCFVAYLSHTSFGWADVLRPALALAALTLSIGELTAPAPSKRRLTALGALSSLSVLYSQEYGLAAIVAAGLSLLAWSVLTTSTAGFRARGRQAAFRAATWLGGIVAVFAATASVYGALGKLQVMLRSFAHLLVLVGSGQLGTLSWRRPVTLESVAHLGNFATALRPMFESAAPYPVFTGIEWVLAPAVYLTSLAALVATAVRRTWSVRSTTLLGLTLFGIATYRITMSRPDVYHLLAGTPAALLLLSMLAADAWEWTTTLTERPVRLVARAALVAAALLSVVLGEAAAGVRYRVLMVKAGKEAPGSRKPHHNPDVPRAGDVFVPEEARQMVRFIGTATRPDEPIFVRYDMLDGAEIYFLADRRNPTRYDTIQEMTLPWMQQEALMDLRAHPPALVIGTNEAFLGTEASAYLRGGWSKGPQFGKYSVATRRPSGP